MNYYFSVFTYFCGWHGGAMVGRQTYDEEVASLIPSHDDCGQVVHIHVPLLPSSIIWYWHKLGRKQAHHAMH